MVRGGSVVKPFGALVHLLRKPHTIRYPAFEHRDMQGRPLPSERYRGFHTNDLLRCIGCGMCGRICMNSAITYLEIPELKELAKGIPKRPVVDYGRCCYCGLCTQICPTGSLKLIPKFEHISKDKRSFRFMPTLDIKAGKGFRLDEREVLFPGGVEFEEALTRLVKRLKGSSGDRSG